MEEGFLPHSCRHVRKRNTFYHIAPSSVPFALHLASASPFVIARFILRQGVLRNWSTCRAFVHAWKHPHFDWGDVVSNNDDARGGRRLFVHTLRFLFALYVQEVVAAGNCKSLIAWACKTGILDGMSIITRSTWSWVFFRACSLNDLPCVRFIWEEVRSSCGRPIIDPTSQRYRAFRAACFGGHLDIITYVWGVIQKNARGRRHSHMQNGLFARVVHEEHGLAHKRGRMDVLRLLRKLRRKGKEEKSGDDDDGDDPEGTK